MVDSNPTETLQELAAGIRVCEACRLCAGRLQAVPGEGNPRASIMFVGEGPGAVEDEQGRPFVGRSGQLLTEMLTEAGIPRSDVFITNVVKCRPPGNRDPLPEEIQACRHWLDRQIEAINPSLIVTLGRISMSRWFPGGRITRIQGQVRNIGGGRRAMPLFHPAAVLRNWRLRSEYADLFTRLARLANEPRPAPAPAEDDLSQGTLFDL